MGFLGRWAIVKKFSDIIRLLPKLESYHKGCQVASTPV
jgi:hypothetical protein